MKGGRAVDTGLRMTGHERLSAKLCQFQPPLTLGLRALASERDARGLPVYDFGLGETKGDLAPYISGAGADAFRDGDTRYSDPAGLPTLRRAVLRWLNLGSHYEPDNVVISTGAKQSLFHTFLALCDPADRVLLDAAPWVSYQPLVTMAAAVPVVMQPRRRAPRSCKITADDLTRHLDQQPRTKLFLLNSPCNPTGEIYSPAEIDALLSVCVERQVFLVLDRLYWRLIFDGASYPEPRIDPETKRWLIQIDGLSKNFRRTGGIRIGWCIAPTDVARAMVNLQSHSTAGPAVPTQRAALAALTHPYSAELVHDLQRRRDLLQRQSATIPHVSVWPTAGAFYSFWDVRDSFGLRIPAGDLLRNSDDVAAYLLRAAGVVTASGAAFMQDGYLRLSFATAYEEEIVAGMAAARRAFAALTATGWASAAAGAG